MKERLLELMVCPEDHSALRLGGETARDGVEIVEGTLICERGHTYEVRAGVPRMAAEAAAGAGEQAGTFDSFSEKWKLLGPQEWEQLDAFQHEWYVQRFGWGSEGALAEHLTGQSHILDAGTGLGRDSGRYARLAPRAEVVGFDLSEAIVIANKRFGGLPNTHFVQADIMKPPFAPATFGFVVSDQVIHHTPSATHAFETLARLIQPGGQLATYVYKRKAFLRELADDHVREITTRMSVNDCLRFSEGITELGRALSKVSTTIRLERGIPELGIPPGEHDTQRLVYWHFLKCFWNEGWSEQLNVLTNFNWYHPPYASRHDPDEVSGWCASAGLDVLHLDVGDSGISVRAAVPLVRR